MGDTIRFGANLMRLEVMEPGRVLVWRSQDGNWTWSFTLVGGHGPTRLISRYRYRIPTIAARLAMLMLEPASLVMERGMLRGIRRRAERLAAAAPARAARRPRVRGSASS